MAGKGPNWDGLLKWSLSHSDGTSTARELSEEDRRWFMEAMQEQSIDVIKRMKEITLVMKTPEHVLVSQGVTPQDIEDMLDELQEHVESIDMANDLHSIGGLAPLLGYLKNANPGIRAKAAEVVSTIVQNNPKSQQLVLEANGLEPLFSNFTSDSDTVARTKALGAISSLIRNNKPGITAFRLANGYGALRDALSTQNVRFQRKAISLVEYLLHENRSDHGIISELGFPRIFMHLASSQDAEVREAALRGLLELSREASSMFQGGSAEEAHSLKKILEERIKGFSEMPMEDLSAARDERQLVDSLWRSCYNEPSPLGEKGLLILPGDDAPPPDIASIHFEPALRGAFAVNRNPDAKSSGEQKNTPLLLGP